MKTGNRRRRKLNRLAKARALRMRCERWQQMEAVTRKWDQENRHYSFPQPDTNDMIMSTIDFSWSD